ncbi:glycoside hydrolase family protein [Celeribacter indicus]|uniref:Lysozyme n=1 Tax=Celeribacter indicus TaxID=1208324 RepID=A0A0B5DZ45_9RHOB|nr:glycoside hydrolase family protein [Celeribacter indicus]AJE46006.1 glycoside hydrolase family protein [Celeribacter indicus]SDX32693.1 Phage-related lysozyme (muramidase), GH24 family [Celeribacter indicus]
MSKLEQIASTKASLAISGGSIAWPLVAPSPDQYANFLNLIVIPTIGAAIALVTLLIKGREWLRGRTAAFHRDESGAIGKRGVAGVTAAAVFAIAVPFGMKWEGTVLTPYWDRFAKIWTVCTGQTGVEMRTYTLPECMEMHETRIAEGYARMIRAYPKLQTAPVEVQAMAVDLEYNAGLGTIRAARNTNAALRDGRWRDFCNILPQWNKSGGRFVQGLFNRRKEAQQICLAGVE